MKIVGIYNRVSREKQIERVAYAVEMLSDSECEIYTDLASKFEPRTPYERLIDDIKLKKFNAVVVNSVDRLTQQTDEMDMFMRLLIENNTKLYIVKEGRLIERGDMEDEPIVLTKEVIIRSYRKKMGEHIRRGKALAKLR